MRILGIDPGLAIVGYGVIEHEGNRMTPVDYGKIITTPKETLPQRLQGIFTSMVELMETYRPDAVAVEELFFAKNVTTGIQVGHARGVILLVAYQKGCPLYEYTPMQIKQAVTGYGGAQKKQVQQMMKMLLHLEEIPQPDDVADALAVAMTHAQAGVFAKQFRV